ncbi:MAG: hypothetical protein A2Z29_09085 [Chloroflexi bacterium RBG_16_56_11]|nr:MAG: hypothetical protein A2Z29_09085 [Chloroflexi bacterium RBG_16_56_11]
MPKKVIQVPIDDDLLKNLDSLSRKQHKARSALIRQACVRYLQQAADDELDALYQQGYSRIPEKPEIGESQIVVLGDILPGEPW